ncbi:MAG: hypothetical protein ACRENC_05810, partial [Gemmatimonadaceae bacterium]
MSPRVIIAKLGRARQSLQHFHLRFLELTGALPHPLRQRAVLILQQAVQQPRLEQIPHVQQQLRRLERFGMESVAEARDSVRTRRADSSSSAA